MQKTIINLWKQNFKRSKKDNFIWDNVLWLQTKKDFILKAYFIAGRIKKIKWDYIWIMLPAVSWASLLIMATYLAGKIPVMFNWTLPEDAFKHCVNFSKVDKIISVSSFFDRVKNDYLEKYKKSWKFIFLEDLLKDWKITEKIKAFLNAIFMLIPKKNKENDIAVILFTSWSESLPKAVPLTHENLIENITWALKIFKLKTDDRLIGFLPPFHSFGFTINTIMPLITALQVVYTPDPNDAKTILDIIKHTKVTALTATPTFLQMIMTLAKPNDLKTLRYAVVWAEKCSSSIFNKFKELCPDGKILEWYGITECSPVVAINPISNPKPWTVWKIIPCLDCKIVDVNNLEKEMQIWEQWMILVSWESIFSWYLDSKLESPFIDINSKSYYKTWDLGFLDKDSFLTITWRLKRFIKIAWEMISLPFIEEVLLKKYNTGEELNIAIEALEKDGKTKIVLFWIEDLSIDEVNEYMRNNWVPNLVKIEEFIKVDEIPVLGTWKTDYKVLKKMIKI